MPELPEVEAIARVASRAIGKRMLSVEVLRKARYFDGMGPGVIDGEHGFWPPMFIADNVVRRGKYIVMRSTYSIGGDSHMLVIHNAMSGYLDWEDAPWAFDYVEGRRTATDSDVRIRFNFVDGSVMRFHDSRLFGSVQMRDGCYEEEVLPALGPEPVVTPMMYREVNGPGPITVDQFYRGLRGSLKPVKEVLMDQSFMAGIGNIYANEACHVAGVDPRWPACSVPVEQVPLLLEAVRLCVLRQIPQVRYDWLDVYRRQLCGTCGGPVTRTEIAKRATFSCERCQWEP